MKQTLREKIHARCAGIRTRIKILNRKLLLFIERGEYHNAAKVKAELSRLRIFLSNLEDDLK